MLLIAVGEKQRQAGSWTYRSGSLAHSVSYRPIRNYVSKRNKEDGTGGKIFEIFLWPPQHTYPPTQRRENERELKDSFKVSILNPWIAFCVVREKALGEAVSCPTEYSFEMLMKKPRGAWVGCMQQGAMVCRWSLPSHCMDSTRIN